MTKTINTKSTNQKGGTTVGQLNVSSPKNNKEGKFAKFGAIATGILLIIGLLTYFGIDMFKKKDVEEKPQEVYNTTSENQSGGITAGKVQINITNISDVQISVEKLSGNIASDQGYRSEFLLRVDTSTPINNLYVQANVKGVVEMDVIPQRTGVAMFGHSGTRDEFAFTNIPSAYGDYKIRILTSEEQAITFDISRE